MKLSLRHFSFFHFPFFIFHFSFVIGGHWSLRFAIEGEID